MTEQQHNVDFFSSHDSVASHKTQFMVLQAGVFHHIEKEKVDISNQKLVSLDKIFMSFMEKMPTHCTQNTNDQYCYIVSRTRFAKGKWLCAQCFTKEIQNWP